MCVLYIYIYIKRERARERESMIALASVSDGTVGGRKGKENVGE
jgi:hypothetical protein